MKVSVCIITYNHEPYIAQAIEGALMQQTHFPYEIIIGEDDSSDKTRAIVKAYGERCPNTIQVLLNDRRKVIYIDGRPTGRWNFVNTLQHARGEYIALLEGDDYWTDPLKLQKQVEFLDSHPECAICFHDVMVVYEDKRQEPRRYSREDQKEISTLEDLLVRNFIPTCSAVFRNGLYSEFPQWFNEIPAGDWGLHLLNAQHGKIGYLSETMGVYRVHRGAAWSGRSWMQQLEGHVAFYKAIEPALGMRYQRILRELVSRDYCELAEAHRRDGDLRMARAYAIDSLRSAPINRHRSPRRMLKLMLRLCLPTPHSRAGRFQHGLGGRD